MAYSVYNRQPSVQSSIQMDIDRIKIILNSKEILYRQTRYFYEFIFNDKKWDRNLFIFLNRIVRQCKNEVRFTYDINGHLLVLFDRWKILSRDVKVPKNAWDYKG